MKEVGTYISKHKPKMVTVEMVREADQVILMGCGRDACPSIPKKVAGWNIDDPVRKGFEKFREICEIIKGKVEELLAKRGR